MYKVQFTLNIGKKVFLFFIILFSLIASLSICLWLMLDNANLLTQTQVRRYESHNLAEELRRSSDDLTRMARTYTVTADIRFKKYFEFIAEIRDGKKRRPKNYHNIYWDFITANHNRPQSEGRKISIIDLMKELKFSQDELSALLEAKKLSDDLMNMEIQAFNAMAGRFIDEIGQYSIQGKPDQKMAIKIVHGQKYHQAKSKIMAKVNTFFELLELRTLNEVNIQEVKQERVFFIAVMLVVLLIGVSIFGYFYFNNNIVHPLNDMRQKVKKMQNGTYEFNNIKRKDEIGLLMSSFSDMATIVSTTINDLEQISRTDQLTKIKNRIALDDFLSKEKYKFDRYYTECSVILVDVDHFKIVNDQFGHLVGDKVLIEIAGLLKDNIRKSDVVGRWGGEEFLIICPNTNIEQAKTVAESIRNKISNYVFLMVGHQTASFGVSTLEKNSDLAVVLDAADKALYKAKALGRNRVC